MNRITEKQISELLAKEYGFHTSAPLESAIDIINAVIQLQEKMKPIPKTEISWLRQTIDTLESIQSE